MGRLIDREKVIKALECCQMVYECKPYEKCPYSNGYECGDCDINRLHYDALALLKEQEAMKPISKSRHGANPQIQHFCRRCNAMLFHHKQKYCIECGQAVKWND